MPSWSLIGEIWTTPGPDAPGWKREVYAEFEEEVREFTTAAAEFERLVRDDLDRVNSLQQGGALTKEDMLGHLSMRSEEQRLEDEWDRLYSRFQHALEQAEASARDA